MAVWSGLISSRVTRFAAHVVDNGAVIDGLLSQPSGPRLELAEAVGRALDANGISMPLTDAQALARMRDRGDLVAVDLTRSGYLLALADGRLALSIGAGHTVESRGDMLAIVLAPEPGRYVAAYALPGVAYMGESSS